MSGTHAGFTPEQITYIKQLIKEEIEKHITDIVSDHEHTTWHTTATDASGSGNEDLTSLDGVKKFLKTLFLDELQKRIKN